MSCADALFVAKVLAASLAVEGLIALAAIGVTEAVLRLWPGG